MARVVRAPELGEPEVMRIEDLAVRAPGDGEVRLRVEAIGLNRSEAMFRKGAYPQRPTLPTLLGYEGVGVVLATGPGVQGFKQGDRVCVVPMYRLGEYGMYAEETVVPARCLLHAPAGLSSVEAASIWMQYFTAMGIIEIGKATVGDYVIIPAASSSVGLAAIQLANWAGATPIAATRRSDKVAALEALGAKHVIATEEQDLVAEVMRITQGQGARLVFGPRRRPRRGEARERDGGRGHSLHLRWPQRPGNRLSPLARGAERAQHPRLGVFSIWNHPERYARAQGLVLRGLADGALKPVIAKTFPLSQIVEAHGSSSRINKSEKSSLR